MFKIRRQYGIGKKSDQHAAMLSREHWLRSERKPKTPG